MHQRLAHILELGADNHFVVITRRSLVPAARINHGDTAAVLQFHVLVGKSKLAEQFHTPHFKPYEMIPMMDNAHLVGLGLAHANRGFAHPSAHFPLQMGLRFSRNDATPSWKSAVCRIAALSRTAF